MHAPQFKTRIQDLQIDALKKSGSEKIYTDKVSGTVSERLRLIRLKEQLRREQHLLFTYFNV